MKSIPPEISLLLRQVFPNFTEAGRALPSHIKGDTIAELQICIVSPMNGRYVWISEDPAVVEAAGLECTMRVFPDSAVSLMSRVFTSIDDAIGARLVSRLHDRHIKEFELGVGALGAGRYAWITQCPDVLEYLAEDITS